MSIKLINTEISQLVREISRKMDSILLPISDKNNLTIMKLKVLLEISKKKDSNIGEIGQSLGVAGGNISNMCKTLEKEGYLKRTRSKEDERVVTVTLTKKGEDVLSIVNDQIDKKFVNYNNDVSDEEHHQIIDSLKLLNQRLDSLVSFK
ncbi:MarR family winged helix-turn-helix transcriptional regulator [Miniphocaeibacter massiliensis]|uniref:MarR family winged helix-turn-helix transcriptional regulator n=1 Tax=Miniphocaeibacter massiliensis TaxID=2041841 RepID=UPI000C1C0151|nr:MarR family winged helix-turn-helix transcriptional regulator [Miniphocaeibacter massiliensis]